MKKPRRYFELRWDDELLWHLVERETGKIVHGLRHFAMKDWALYKARRHCRDHQPSELVIYNKDGKIGKGPTSRATYGLDPRRSKG